jgi:hypothetical protein
MFEIKLLVMQDMKMKLIGTKKLKDILMWQITLVIDFSLVSVLFVIS